MVDRTDIAWCYACKEIVKIYYLIEHESSFREKLITQLRVWVSYFISPRYEHCSLCGSKNFSIIELKSSYGNEGLIDCQRCKKGRISIQQVGFWD